MDKKVILHDYRERAVEFTIKGFEYVEQIVYLLVSGDGVLHIYYKDGGLVIFDSCPDCERKFYMFDGMVRIPLDKIDYLSSLASPFEVLDNFGPISRREEYAPPREEENE